MVICDIKMTLNVLWDILLQILNNIFVNLSFPGANSRWHYHLQLASICNLLMSDEHDLPFYSQYEVRKVLYPGENTFLNLHSYQGSHTNQRKYIFIYFNPLNTGGRGVKLLSAVTVHIHTHTNTHTHTHTHTYTYMHICTHAHMFIHIHTYTDKHMHIKLESSIQKLNT